MNDQIVKLESKRKSLYKKLKKLGNFRRVLSLSITENVGKKIAIVQNLGIQGMDHNIYEPQQSKKRAIQKI